MVKNRYFFPLLIVLIASATFVYAFTTLFTQTFPPATTGATLVIANCSTLSASSSTAVSGQITFGCTTPTGSAFHTGTASATVSGIAGGVPNGYTDLYAIPTGATVTTTCNVAGSIILMSTNTTPGSAITITVLNTAGQLAASTSYYYCADFNVASGQSTGTFTATWQQ